MFNFNKILKFDYFCARLKLLRPHVEHLAWIVFMQMLFCEESLPKANERKLLEKVWSSIWEIIIRPKNLLDFEQILIIQSC